MPNKNYVRGRNFEYKVKKAYEEAGYLVFRTAGSHSPADLIAFPPLGKITEWQPILIQCKASDKRLSKQEITTLSHTALKYGLRAKIVQKNNATKCGFNLVWIVKK